jgi:hypothetical protein
MLYKIPAVILWYRVVRRAWQSSTGTVPVPYAILNKKIWNKKKGFPDAYLHPKTKTILIMVPWVSIHASLGHRPWNVHCYQSYPQYQSYPHWRYMLCFKLNIKFINANAQEKPVAIRPFIKMLAGFFISPHLFDNHFPRFAIRQTS